MRKLLSASLLALVLVISTAAPAFAIRDPFDPVITQAELTGSGGTGSTSGDGTGTAGSGTDIGTGTGTNVGGSTTGTNGSEGLANTGADPEPWLVAAFALIAIGGAALMISKTYAQPA